MVNNLHIVRLLIVFSFLFISELSFPQLGEIKFEHITTEDGLPDLTVICVLQDHLGFLWLGTWNGLVKYDGYSMTVYRPEPDDSNSLSQRTVRALYEDRSGNLWIGTGWIDKGGLNRFDRATETFTRYMYDPDDSTSINFNYIKCIYEDSAGQLWVGTTKGLNLFDSKNNNFHRFYFPDSSFVNETNINSSKLIEGAILAITEDRSNGNLLMGTEFPGLWTLDVNRNLIEKYHLADSANQINSFPITDFYQAKDGIIWLGTSTGLARFDPSHQEIKYYPHFRSSVYDANNDFNPVLEDQYGLIWKGGFGNGLILFDPQTEQFQRYWYDRFDPGSLYGNYVNSLYEDHSGIIWVGMQWYGLNKFAPQKMKFKYISHNPRNTNSLSANDVYAVCEDRNGIIWIGTINGGVNRYDRKANRFTHYRHNPHDTHSLSDDDVWSIIEDPYEKDILWVGTQRGGLNKFETETGLFKRYLNDPANINSISHNRIMSLFVDRQGTLWIGTWGGGLNRFDRTTNKFTRFQNDPNDPGSLSQDEVAFIYEDRSGILWVGTNIGGLNRFNRKTEEFIIYKSLLKEEGPSSISCIYEDRQGNFWLGTRSSGIHLFDRSKGISIKSFDDKDGLANNWVHAILEDSAGNLWISTANGLSKFNPHTEAFNTYGISDGLEGVIFSPRSAFKGQNGEMFFGGEFGINIFHPDSVKDDPIPPQVVISNISLINNPGEKIKFDGFISELNEINLSFDQNDLRFDFLGLHYSEPEKNAYTYKLENYNNNWIDAGTQRNATYTNLDPGEYIFRVKAANRDGIWNEEGALIKIIILPPWWATVWAYIVYVLIIISITYFTWRLQLKRIRIKHDYEMSRFEAEKLHEVDNMKSRFFANISHEFRTPLTLIVGPVKDIINRIKDEKTKTELEIVHRNASRLNGLVNQLLDLSKLEAGKMKLETHNENIVPLLKGLVQSFASHAERKKITLKFYSDSENIKAYIDRDKIEKIMNNLLSNAFKFTPEGGKVEVKIERSKEGKLQRDEILEIKVSDTGIGIPKERVGKIFDRFYQVDGSHTREQEGTGIGLALTKELVELQKGEIELESEIGIGTTFTVRIPLGKAHLKSEEICGEKVREAKEHIPITTLLPDKGEGDERIDIGVITDTEKPLLLIVEDNKDVRNYVRNHLDEDYRILEAVNGEDGLNRSIEFIPDLIISDVMMPKMDGFELCGRLKTDERTSHIPVILLTAKSESEDKIEGLETGADDYILKPFDAKELQVRIRNLIDQRKKLREHFRKEGLFEINDKNINSVDKTFLKKSVDIINEHISDPTFSVDMLADNIGMSRSQLHRKLVALVGESPGDLIRRIRLTKAAKLIEEKFGNISEIALEVGFNHPSNFARSFTTQFGISPSEYEKKVNC